MYRARDTKFGRTGRAQGRLAGRDRSRGSRGLPRGRARRCHALAPEHRDALRRRRARGRLVPGLRVRARRGAPAGDRARRAQPATGRRARRADRRRARRRPCARHHALGPPRRHVILTQKGSAKVLEFGMSRWTRGGATRARAAEPPDALPSAAVSTVSYMSPEQALGSPVDARTDVFSLGVAALRDADGTVGLRRADRRRHDPEGDQRAAAVRRRP